MWKGSPSSGASFVLMLGALALSGCPFDSTPRTIERGTLGEEIYKVVCERMATEVWPTDVQGNQSRALCRGEAPPSTAPAGSRLEALAENRDRIVRALDQTLPEDLEDPLQDLLLEMLPFYDPPSELFPSNTRAIAGLLTDLMERDEVMDALGQVSARRGLRPQRHAVGITRPLLSYSELSPLASATFSLVSDGGSLESEWEDLLEASALEMATCEPSPADDPTLGLTRDFLLRTAPEFGPLEPRPLYVVARDTRGLPIPAFLDGSQGFVDLDTDGLADADSLGRFLDAEGALLNPPTPFAVVGETGATRDEFGRAMTAGDEPLYVYRDLEGTVLAGLLREVHKLVDPNEPVLVDFIEGMVPLLGPGAARTETYGDLDASFDGFATEDGAIFDVVYAITELLKYDETRDVLTIVDEVLTNHEETLVPLIEAGLWGDALGDEHPEIDLAQGSELWDDVIRVAQWMAEKPGMLEDVLRAFNDPRSRRLGPIFAETMRFKDVPTLNSADVNERLDDVYWTIPVDRTMPDAPGNQSLFQQTLAGIHELNGAALCNKEGARMILDLDVLGASLGVNLNGLKNTASLFGLDWDDGLDITSLGEFLNIEDLGPWGECDLLEVDNAARAFARSVIGRQELVMNLGGLTALVDFFDAVGLGGTIDSILAAASGIDGFDRTPSPHALARLMFGPSNHFIDGLIDPPRTIYGDVFRTRYNGQMVLAWEREFRFCGDRILDEGETCATPEEVVSLYDALTPMLEVLDDYDVDANGVPLTPRFLFAELVSAFHMHYATSANPMHQSTNPAGPRFVNADGAVTYEPIAADLMGGCAWVDQGNGDRICRVDQAGRLISRLARVTAVLENVEVSPGVDGLAVAGRALEKFLNPALNPGLANRAGETTTQTNSGTRTLQMTPMHLLLDGLNRMDEAHESDLARSERWYAARSRLVDMFLERDALPNDEFILRNRRLYAFMLIVADFAADLIDDHAAAGDLDEWVHTLDVDLEDSMTGYMGSSTIRFLDATGDDSAATNALLELLSYFVTESSPNEAFENLLYTAGDSLYLLEDDDAVITLLNAFANAFATDASAAIAGAGTTTVDGSAADEAVNLLSSVANVDTALTFQTVLRNAVTHHGGDLETPLEVLGDVIAEVNRANPNKGGPLAPDDYGAVFEQTEDMLIDPDRGLERVYGIVQNRELVR